MGTRQTIERVFGPILSKMPRTMWQLRHLRHFHSLINWNKPQNIYAKMAQLAVANRNNPQWAMMADKWGVRDYVSRTIGEQYLVKSYGMWHRAVDIDFDVLPARFVLKTNNACATNLLVRDKSQLDIEAARQQLDKWLKVTYGALTGEGHYLHIKPVIIAEEFLDDGAPEGTSLKDYKFYCFNGEPRYMMLCSGRKANTHSYDLMIYDMEWGAHPEMVDANYPRQISDCPKPATFELMKELARKLSQGLKFVRVDFYDVKGEVKFGEITLTPGMDYSSPECLRRFLELVER